MDLTTLHCMLCFSAPCRTSVEETSAQESEVKANNANPLVFPKPSHISQDQPDAAHLLC